MSVSETFKLSLLTKLETEHRKAERLLARLDKADTAAKQQPLVDQLLAAMAQHMQTEETKVYPVLREIDGEMATEAQIEHGLARTGLQQLAAMVGRPGFGAAVAMVQAGIAHHVQEEETEAFPKIRKAMAAKPSRSSAAATSAKPRRATAHRGAPKGSRGTLGRASKAAKPKASAR